jgi:hypothetical protein
MCRATGCSPPTGRVCSCLIQHATHGISADDETSPQRPLQRSLVVHACTVYQTTKPQRLADRIDNKHGYEVLSSLGKTPTAQQRRPQSRKRAEAGRPRIGPADRRRPSLTSSGDASLGEPGLVGASDRDQVACHSSQPRAHQVQNLRASDWTVWRMAHGTRHEVTGQKERDKPRRGR